MFSVLLKFGAKIVANSNPEKQQQQIMVLWVDKYRPSTFDKLEIHKELSTQLKNIVQTGDFPHLLFYGPSGAGKKTRILALLRQIYGSKVEKVCICFAFILLVAQ